MDDEIEIYQIAGQIEFGRRSLVVFHPAKDDQPCPPAKVPTSSPTSSFGDILVRVVNGQPVLIGRLDKSLHMTILFIDGIEPGNAEAVTIMKSNYPEYAQGARIEFLLLQNMRWAWDAAVEELEWFWTTNGSELGRPWVYHYQEGNLPWTTTENESVAVTKACFELQRLQYEQQVLQSLPLPQPQPQAQALPPVVHIPNEEADEEFELELNLLR